MVSPWRRISGSATPRLSTRSRIFSTARSRLSSLYSVPGLGCWVTEMPPCRSRPSAGLLSVMMVSSNAPYATTMMLTSEMMQFATDHGGQDSSLPALDPSSIWVLRGRAASFGGVAVSPLAVSTLRWMA